MWDKLIHLLKWSNLILVLTTLLCYGSPYVNPQYFWYLALLGLSYPLLLIANAGFSLFWLANRSRYFLFSTCCIILGWGHLNGIIAIGGIFSQKRPFPESSLKIVSYNCGNIRTRGSGQRSGPEVWQKEIAKMEADILCLQEFPSKYSDRRYFQPYLAAFQDYTYNNEPSKGNKELAIYSKFPIIDYQLQPFENSINGFCIADVDWNGQIIRIINIHLQSMAISKTVDQIAEEGQLQKKDTWRGVKNILRKFRDGAKDRAMQSTLIARHIKESPYPVIVCGDFNDVPQSYAYRQIARSLRDGFREAGKGRGSTYAGRLPFLRIDYIMVSSFFRVNSAGVFRDNSTSDHHPVWASMRKAGH